MRQRSPANKSSAASELLHQLASGNSEALNILTELRANANRLDPTHAPDAWHFYASRLDRLCIRGAELLEFSNLCGNRITAMMTVLRAQNLSLLTSMQLREASTGEGTLPCLIWLNEEIREQDPLFCRLND